MLKDAELLPLVLAARRGYQRRHRHRQPPGATAAASRWAVAAVPAVRLQRYRYDAAPPPHPPGATAANNSNNRARNDTVSALMHQKWASLAFLMLALSLIIIVW